MTMKNWKVDFSEVWLKELGMSDFENISKFISEVEKQARIDTVDVVILSLDSMKETLLEFKEKLSNGEFNS